MLNLKAQYKIFSHDFPIHFHHSQFLCCFINECMLLFILSFTKILFTYQKITLFQYNPGVLLNSIITKLCDGHSI